VASPVNCRHEKNQYIQSISANSKTEKKRPEDLSRLIEGLETNPPLKSRGTFLWTREFAASGKNCAVVGVHEPLWTEKLPTCDKSGKITN